MLRKIKEILKKELAASATLENAIIMPIFIMILVSFVLIASYYHDRIVLRNIVEQAAIEYEYEFINAWQQTASEVNKQSEEEFCKSVEDYANKRMLFIKNVDVSVSSTSNNTEIIAKAKFTKESKFISKDVKSSVSISVANPKKWIRITNAFKEAIKK